MLLGKFQTPNKQIHLNLVVLITNTCIVFGQSYSQPPNLTISAPQGGQRGNGDVDFQNETILAMSNSFVKALFNCKADYPIEIVPSFDELDDGQAIFTKNASSKRQTSDLKDFWNPLTYTYEIELLLEFHGKITSNFNVSCHGTVGNTTKLTTQVSAELSPNRREQLIEFRVLDGGNYLPPQTPKLSSECSLNIEVIRFHQDISKNASIPRQAPRYCVRCTDLTGAEVREDVHACHDPMQCSTYFSAVNLGTRCLKTRDIILTPAVIATLQKDLANVRCIFPQYQYPNTAKMLVCKHFGLLQSQMWVPGIPLTPEIAPLSLVPVDPVENYFSWDEIDPSKMLFVYPILEKTFIGQEIMVKCRVASYYFAEGAVFGIGVSFEDQNFTITPANTSIKRPNEGFYTIEATVEVTSYPIFELYCFAPIWNSAEWTNASITLQVDPSPRAPSFDLESEGMDEDSSDTQKLEEIQFTVGEANKSILCIARGRPAPTIQWVAEKSPAELGFEIQTFDSDTENGKTESLIRFHEVGYSISGEYVCVASNFLGNATHTFDVQVDAATSKATIALLLIAILSVTLVPLVLYRTVVIIKQQQNLIRKLTAAEIEEFFKGHPQKLGLHIDSYLNSFDLVQCLPYDSSFEAGSEDIVVDRSKALGAGQYGIVYRGLLRKKDSESEHVNEMIIAVKTVKEDVDVSHFKMLLSELKIMAYLGQHEGIVSLVAAHTTDIANRKILVGLEYCENGCLRNFLIGNRHNFKNLLKPKELGNNFSKHMKDYDNMGDPAFTSIDMMQWTIQVAKGMEYLVYKKIIHADLACRNVLLTAKKETKISDFGLSKQLEMQNSTYVKKTQCALPYKWMAIESLTKMEFSIYSDVWSFGTTIWEIFSFGELPFTDQLVPSEFVKEITAGLRLQLPKWCPDEIYEYMLCCWDPDPKRRPSYDPIIEICKRIIDTTNTL